MRTVKSRDGKKKEIHEDEMLVEMLTALGSYLGSMIMPSKMKELFIEAYKKSSAVESHYLFVDGEEIKDGINYNPFYVIK